MKDLDLHLINKLLINPHKCNLHMYSNECMGLHGTNGHMIVKLN